MQVNRFQQGNREWKTSFNVLSKINSPPVVVEKELEHKKLFFFLKKLSP